MEETEMKIINLMKNQNKQVYFKVNEEQEQPLTFDALKLLAKNILVASATDSDTEYQVLSELTELSLYKDTIESLIKSIVDDKDLLSLYKSSLEGINEQSNGEIDKDDSSDG
jgi:mannitol/fructose-specific phosphotransferase system IIA component (Ntr-type)